MKGCTVPKSQRRLSLVKRLVAGLLIGLVVTSISPVEAATRPSGIVQAPTCDRPHWRVVMRNPVDHAVTFKLVWRRSGETLSTYKYRVAAESRQTELFIPRNPDLALTGVLWHRDRLLDRTTYYPLDCL